MATVPPFDPIEQRLREAVCLNAPDLPGNVLCVTDSMAIEAAAEISRLKTALGWNESDYGRFAELIEIERRAEEVMVKFAAQDDAEVASAYCSAYYIRYGKDA